MPFKNPFYFNSHEQKEGDKAYNLPDYILALKFYETAFKNIKSFASKKVSSNRDIQDGCTYVMTDIIRTCFDVLYLELDSPQILKEGDGYWDKVQKLLEPLRKNKTVLGCYSNAVTTPEIIEETYKIVVDYCEKISEKLISSLPKSPEKSQISIINKAIEWMQRAITVGELYYSNHPNQIEMHIRILTLLEQQYILCKDELTLPRMLKHIERYRLANKKMPLSKKLEILSYYLQCSEDAAKQAEIIAEGKRLIPEIKNKKIVTHFNRCVVEVEQSASDLVDNGVSNDQVKVVENKTLLSEPIIIEEIVNNSASASRLNISLLLQASEEIKEQEELEPTKSMSPPANNNEGSAKKVNSNPSYKQIANFGLFVVPEDYTRDDKPSEFIKLINEVITDYSSPVFMAILLSLLGDFIADNRRSLSLNYFILDDKLKLMAEKIYFTAATIDPHQPKILHNFEKLCGYSISTEINKRDESENKKLVMEAILGLVTSLKTWSGKKIDQLMTEIVNHLIKQITEKNLVNEDTPKFIATMKKFFNKTLSESQNNPSNLNNNEPNENHEKSLTMI